jgi:ectoine hydroxylase
MSADPRKDFYPSRQSPEPRFMERLDPVVFGQWSPSAPITQEQARSFENDGFLVLKNVFDEGEIACLQAEASRLQVSKGELEEETAITEPGGGAVRSIFKIHRQSATFSRLSIDTRLAGIAQFILDDDVYIHQSRLNFKPGFEGKEFYWHSDFETWHVEDGMPRMRAISMSVLLTDNEVINGPTMFMAGSHNRYATCVGETPEDHYKQSLKKQEYGVPDHDMLSDLARGGIAMPTGPAGTVVIFDCNTMHGSNSNITPLPRSNAFFVFNALSNRLVAPFGPETPRPEFIASREHVETIKSVQGRLVKDAA